MEEATAVLEAPAALEPATPLEPGGHTEPAEQIEPAEPVERVEQPELIEPASDAPRFSPHVAAVEMQGRFRRMARLLWPKDYSTQDDLVQVMSLATLQCNQDHTQSYFLQLGVGRAINYLRWWLRPMRECVERDVPAAEQNTVSAAVARAQRVIG